MTKIVFIAGKARSGKDQCAIFLKSILELKHKKVGIVHYADILKCIAQNMFGWDGKKDEQGRQILQYVGTTLVRENYPDCWVDIVKTLIKGLGNEFDYILIPDVRFENELSWCDNDSEEERKTRKAIKVRISRYIPIDGGIIRVPFDNGLPECQKNHISETALDNYNKFDYYLINDGDLDQYYTAVDQLAEKLEQNF